MTTTDRLKAMAEFMGLEIFYDGQRNMWYNDNVNLKLQRFTYNTSFDSLIEVWARVHDGIENLMVVPKIDYYDNFNYFVSTNDCAKAFEVCSDAIEYLNKQNN